MKMIKEFKDFAIKGNVLDLAVAVVIGTAFGKIISSFVSDIITPILGAMTGGTNLTRLAWKVGEVKIKYGFFLQNVFDFIIVALAIFIVVVKILGNLKKKEEKKEEEKGPTQEELLVEIRDLLKKK